MPSINLNWFIGFGFGKAEYTYTYKYQDEVLDTKVINEKIDTSVFMLTFGATSGEAFNKNGKPAFEFGIDLYNLNDAGLKGVETITDVYAAIIWGL